MTIAATFLQDIEHGGPPVQPAVISRQLADFIRGARSSLHLAIYDFRLDSAQAPYGLIVGALKERAESGVQVRIAYDHGKVAAANAGQDPAPPGTAAFLSQAFAGTPIEIEAITDRNPAHIDPRLMHDKYIVRDSASVWTGSLNITDDSLSFQESNIVEIDSPELAGYYETDFSELWRDGDISSSGENDRGTVQVEAAQVEVAFSPCDGTLIADQVASLLAGVRQRIKMASMLIASRPVLQALDQLLQKNQVPDYGGIFDATQMEQTLQNWQDVPHNRDLIPLFERISRPLARKNSVPFAPGSKHNYMHNKVMVVDDCVFTGSFNLSHTATQNAENVLFIRDLSLADQYSSYIDRLVAQYGASGNYMPISKLPFPP